MDAFNPPKVIIDGFDSKRFALNDLLFLAAAVAIASGVAMLAFRSGRLQLPLRGLRNQAPFCGHTLPYSAHARLNE